MVRKFNGKKYEVFDFSFSKREAKKEASGLRKKGNLARVVKAGEGYHVFKGAKK